MIIVYVIAKQMEGVFYMFSKIFYPTDLSERSARDLAWIAEHLADENSQIIIAHSVDTTAGIDTPEVVIQANEAIDIFCKETIPENVTFKALAEAGEKTEVLASIAHREICSVATITTKPGTKIANLIQSLAIPQLILRWETPPENTDTMLKNVVIAIDLESKRTNSILRNVKSIVERLDKDIKITLLHGVPMEDPSTAHQIYNQAAKALEKVRIEVEEWNKETYGELVGGQTEEELPLKIEELKTGLLVLGLPLKGDIWQLLLGNTAEALIERTKCPVLIIPVLPF